VREYGRKGRGRTGEEEGKGREEGGEGMIRNDRPSPHQKILDPPLESNNASVTGKVSSAHSES
jgi:hypothetical protein